MTRKEFTKKTKEEALKRSGHLCEASGKRYGLDEGQRCNQSLSGGCHFDHDTRAADGGDNSLENCRAVCVSCHSWKTRNIDIPGAAKTKRMANKHSGVTRPKQSIKSAGFQYLRKEPLIEKKALPRPRMYEVSQ